MNIIQAKTKGVSFGIDGYIVLAKFMGFVGKAIYEYNQIPASKYDSLCQDALDNLLEMLHSAKIVLEVLNDQETNN